MKTKEEIESKLNQLQEDVCIDDLVSVGFIAALRWVLNVQDK